MHWKLYLTVTLLILGGDYVIDGLCIWIYERCALDNWGMLKSLARVVPDFEDIKRLFGFLNR